MGVTVKKCHTIMSGNDCCVCFSCCRKADNELPDVIARVVIFSQLCEMIM